MTNINGSIVGMRVGDITLDNRAQLAMAIHTCIGVLILLLRNRELHICRKNICSHLHVGNIPEGPCRNLMEGRARMETTKTISKELYIRKLRGRVRHP